jgi:hypothetical protein
MKSFLSKLIGIVAFVAAFAAVRVGMELYQESRHEAALEEATSQAAAENKSYTDAVTTTEDLSEMADLVSTRGRQIDEVIPELEKLAKHTVSKQYIADLKENRELLEIGAAATRSVNAIMQKAESDPNDFTEEDFANLCSAGVANFEVILRTDVLFQRRMQHLEDPKLIGDFGFVGNTAATFIESVQYMYDANKETLNSERQALLELGCELPDEAASG